MITNRYRVNCAVCRKPVEIGEGQLVKVFRYWETKHLACMATPTPKTADKSLDAATADRPANGDSTP